MSLDPRRRRQAPPPPPPPPIETQYVESTTPDGSPTVMTFDGPPRQPENQGDFKLKFCTVCASNQNRSMVGHLNLSSHFPTMSFGTGSLVRLPGPSLNQPNVYHFNSTTYREMHDQLEATDPRLYTSNGLLKMLSRNAGIKSYPERWQTWQPGQPRLDRVAEGDRGAVGTEAGLADVVITCEERCWDAVVENLLERGAPLNRPLHVFNVDIKDNHEDALVGGRGILDLATALNDCARESRDEAGVAGWDDGKGAARAGFDERVPDVLAEWQERWPNLPALWTMAWL